MPRVKRIIRRLLASALYYSGLLWLYAEVSLRDKAVVLMYHRVLPSSADSHSHEGIIVSPQAFATQMKFLRQHFQMLTPEQFGAELSAGKFRRRACLLTFDDGWQDTFSHALPILQRHGIPAVVFVATAFVGTARTFWQERFARLLYLATRVGTVGQDVLAELGVQAAISMDDAAARCLVRDTVTSLKLRQSVDIEGMLERLEVAIKRQLPAALDFGEDHFLTWKEIAGLQHSGLFTVGSHSHTHTPLTSLGYINARSELELSRQVLQRHGIASTWICAYPNGNVDDAVVKAANDAGFSLAFTTKRRHVRVGDNHMRLGRINVHASGSELSAEFLCRVLGLM